MPTHSPQNELCDTENIFKNIKFKSHVKSNKKDLKKSKILTQNDTKMHDLIHDDFFLFCDKMYQAMTGTRSWNSTLGRCEP